MTTTGTTKAWDQRDGMVPSAELDEGLARLGPVLDLDSHEQIPVHMWREVFGEVAEKAAPIAAGLAHLAENTQVRDDLVGDLMEITEHTVWQVKGPEAPSAIDFNRRPAVLDQMGIDRQLVFATFAIFGLHLAYNRNAPTFLQYDPADVDGPVVGREIVEAHNRWCRDVTKALPGNRVRPVAVILADSLHQMMRDSERALADGVLGLHIPCGIPPAETSPADRALDPFWRLASDANVPVLVHLGTEFGLLASDRWNANAPEFLPSAGSSVEFTLEPYRGSTLSFTTENFLTPMILGGVFERHPDLRFGVIECGAQWVGPLAERLDLWADQFSARLSSTLSMKPSEYLARNVRVTPFVFEDVDKYIERNPDLVDAFCYSSDFPHREGGRDSKRRFYSRLSRLGDDVLNKFFLSNGEWIVPAAQRREA
jgi:predicted TIM-barrel fold metal-dependent hydrolase